LVPYSINLSIDKGLIISDWRGYIERPIIRLTKPNKIPITIDFRRSLGLVGIASPMNSIHRGYVSTFYVYEKVGILLLKYVVSKIYMTVLLRSLVVVI